MRNVNKNKQRYSEIEHASHKSNSGQPVRPVPLLVHYFFCLLKKHVKTLQYFICLLNAWMGCSTR